MALTGMISTDDGVIHDKAYLKIDAVVYRKGEVSYSVFIYHNQTAKDEGKNTIFEDNYRVRGKEFEEHFGLDTIKTNPIKAVYEYLKSGRYKGWADA